METNNKSFILNIEHRIISIEFGLGSAYIFIVNDLLKASSTVVSVRSD